MSNVSSEIDPAEEEKKRIAEEEEKARLVRLKCHHFEAFETDSFGEVEDAYSEVTVVEVEPSEDPNDRELAEDEMAEREIVGGEILIEPKWNEGEIIVNVNRCFDCRHHYIYSRHSED